MSSAEQAVELLADGEWHDLEWVIRELGKAIPPGQAVREMTVSSLTQAPET